jgi:hypothetical protein
MLKIITDHRTTSQLHRSSLHLASSISITQNQLHILIENMNSLQHNTIVSLEVPLKRYDSVAPEDGMSSGSSMSETDALLDEQNDTPVAANIGPNVRAPWQSVKWCASSLAKSVQLGARLVHGQYSSVVARVLNRQEGYHDAVEMQPVPGRAEFLMLVYSGKHAVDKLHQVRLAGPPESDTEFFQFLRKEYYANRERSNRLSPWWKGGLNPWWRQVREIYFVQFVTRTSTPRQHNVQITATKSVPTMKNLEWERTLGPLDPPSSNLVTRLFLAREAHYGELDTALEIPRKLNTKIPDIAGQTGWGLYFLEETRWTLVYNLLVLWLIGGCALLLALMFSM